MNKKTLFINADIIFQHYVSSNSYLIINGHLIEDFGEMASCPQTTRYDYIYDLKNNSYISPGFIDLHIHGVAGADAMDGTATALKTISQILPKEGTTSFLATTITSPIKKISQAIESIAHFHSYKGAKVLGIHLEGPFINLHQAGAQPKADIQESNPHLFSYWQSLAQGQIKLVTYAPEMDPRQRLLQQIIADGAIPSIGHSEATYEQVETVHSYGVSHMTHLFNGMLGIHHREIGTAGAALLLNSFTAEIIADGLHISPEMIQLLLKVKGYQSLILITDSIRAKHMQDGEYELGGQTVHLQSGVVTLVDGTLAGSILKMNDAIKNMIHFTGIALHKAVHMATVNPAKKIGQFHCIGSIDRGKEADLVILNRELNVIDTFCKGERM
ncbi:N-acetylglucosamine-6-phosphate deacetylase [Cytobacillus sp. OWB-43]|uniref:N-acetylglucosamine-6-phosphate deacetylase n=1 Tax=Cytobacillus sp. OWB-43 TaxID=3108468 RepID=UPI002AFF13CE|nr:N-acetylglucosamine-6-phosphate deacetylase [Cytobacillus sp. OWB-43]MEA1855399.1 N-acetylglucosamine-6-phosphate deacetylase [Cytobacillus sp. OWB-43]